MKFHVSTRVTPKLVKILRHGLCQEKERLVAQFKITEQQLRRQIRLEHRRPGSARSEHRGPLRVPPSPKMAPERGRLNAGDAPQPAAAASPQPDEVGEGATRPCVLASLLLLDCKQGINCVCLVGVWSVEFGNSICFCICLTGLRSTELPQQSTCTSRRTTRPPSQ